MAVAIGLFGNRFVDSFFASIFVLRSGNGEKDEKDKYKYYWKPN